MLGHNSIILFLERNGEIAVRIRAPGVSSVGSAHRIFSSTVKLSLRSSKKAKPHPMKIIDWKAVSANSVLSIQFSLDFLNKFESLSTSYVDADNIEDVYRTLIKCTEEVASPQKGEKFPK